VGRVEGKVIAITGAGSGIGEGAALLCAAEGAKVFLIGRTLSKLEHVAARIREQGGEAEVAAGDLQWAEVVDQVFDQLLATYGRVDALINCAGVGSNWSDVSPGSMNDIATTPLDKYHEVMRINLDSVVFMCRRAVQKMREQGKGSIVNISSIYGIVGAPTHHTYAMTKAAIAHLTRGMAVGYARDGIRVNCVVPGFIATPMNDSVMGIFDNPEYAASLMPIARPGTPLELAQACLYLASDESSYTTGVILPVDGGWSAK
jgi:meso-butanediol dehydrogenase/(S,S)-butanediol dehydrogenase/diacetyl reductase